MKNETELDTLQNPCNGTNGMDLEQPTTGRQRFVFGVDKSVFMTLELLLKHLHVIGLVLVALVLAWRV